MNLKNILYITTLTGCLCWGLSAHAHIPLDSIRVENQQGKKVIVHLVEAKETYYSLGRKYGVSPKSIMDFNKNQALRMNDIIKIPTGQPYSANARPATADPVPKNTNQQRPSQEEGFTKYKVGKGETLYSIARRFDVTEEQIMAANGMANKNLQADQILRIPHQSTTTAAPQISENETPIPEEEPEEPVINENRYGIRQMSEKGIGIWLEGLNADGGKMLALHKTAPVGTVVKITNPMTERSTFAKVVGKYTDTSLTQDAIIVISKAAASQIGILDKRFLVQISYGMPEH